MIYEVSSSHYPEASIKFKTKKGVVFKGAPWSVTFNDALFNVLFMVSLSAPFSDGSHIPTITSWVRAYDKDSLHVDGHAIDVRMPVDKRLAIDVMKILSGMGYRTPLISLGPSPAPHLHIPLVKGDDKPIIGWESAQRLKGTLSYDQYVDLSYKFKQLLKVN